MLSFFPPSLGASVPVKRWGYRQMCALAVFAVQHNKIFGIGFKALLDSNWFLSPAYTPELVITTNSAYNPHTPQFGAVLIDKVNEHLFYHGRFSFHKQTQPYADLSVEAARERFPEPFEVVLYDRFAYAEASDSLEPFRYWFRQEADTNDLLVVGYFGWKHTILCTLKRH